jgi:hypothetical protein
MKAKLKRQILSPRFRFVPAMLSILMWAASALAVNNGDVPINTPDSARRMILDLSKTFEGKYKGGAGFLERLSAIETTLKATPDDAAAKGALETLIREASLANPLLDIDKILVIRRKGEANRGLNSYTSDTIRRTGWDNDIAEVSALRTEPTARRIYQHPNQSVMKHMILHFSGERIMFSGVGTNGQWAVLDVDKHGADLRELTPTD